MTPYPVSFDVVRPPTFQRAHVVVRVALLIVVGWIAHPIGLLWLGVPVVAALVVAQRGGRRYVDEDGAVVSRALGWVVGFIAYLALLTDSLPGAGEQPVRFEVERSGTPTVASALLRILYAIPSVVVLAILTWVGSVVWILAALFVLVGESYPESLWRFLCGIVRWNARLVAYLASLVDRYPPFVLETASASPAAPSS